MWGSDGQREEPCVSIVMKKNEYNFTLYTYIVTLKTVPIMKDRNQISIEGQEREKNKMCYKLEL